MERRKILLFGSINDGVYYCIRFGSKERTEKSCDFLLRLMSRGRVNDIKFFCFLKTVICYLLSVTQKIHLWKLSTVNCNAWCELALSKKTGTVLVFQESETYFSFSITVIL